jgi:hypothetical protein
MKRQVLPVLAGGLGGVIAVATVLIAAAGIVLVFASHLFVTAQGPPPSPSSTFASASPPTSAVTLALHDGEELSCRSTPDGAECAIHGTAQRTSGMQVLLWVEPVSPPSGIPGYWIQRGGYGVTRQPRPEATSTWVGAILIGNAQYPPCRGDTVNVIVTLDEASVAEELLSGPQQMYPDPTHQSLASAEADNLRISGVPSCHR